MKTCVCCKLSKPETEFHVGRRFRDGLRPSCKSCARAADRADHVARVARTRRWRQKNPHRYLASKQRRRARLAAALATLTAEQWAAILELYEGKCAYCGRAGKMTMDHVVPVTRGGGTTADNVVPACKSCNSSKGTKTPQEWKN